MRQCSRVSLRIFLSTPSARRATYAKVWNEWFRDISIHALLMQTGVKRVEVRSPVFTTVADNAVAQIGTVSVVNGGAERE